MTVYVDDMRAPYPVSYGTLLLSHMFADTPLELEEMARKLRLKPSWIQNKPPGFLHYDIADSKRALAVEYGAVQVGFHETPALARRIGLIP